MIKVLNIKTRKEYNKLLNDYLLLSVASLKYISKKDNFKEIVVQAKEVEQASFQQENITFPPQWIKCMLYTKMNILKLKGGKMRIEILLKEIRTKKRIQPGKVVKNDRNIKFTFKLYRTK